MNIKALKGCILANNIPKFLIFNQQEPALAKQYVEKISNTLNKNLKYFDNLDELIIDIQSNISNDAIYIYLKNEYDNKYIKYIDTCININKYIYLLFDNIDKKDNIYENYSDYIINFNKLDTYTILAYIEKVLKDNSIEINQELLIKLIENSNNNLGIILNELDKIIVLQQDNSNILMNYMLENGFSDYREINLFSFINKLLKKDITVFNEFYKLNESTVNILLNLYKQSRMKFIDTKNNAYLKIMKLTGIVLNKILDGTFDEKYALKYILIQIFNEVKNEK